MGRPQADPTAVLERNAAGITGRGLVLGCPGADHARRLDGAATDAELCFLSDDFSLYRPLRTFVAHTHFGAWSLEPCAWDTVVIYATRGRAHAGTLLAGAAHAARPGARLLLTGPKRGGIRTIARQVDEGVGFGLAERLDVARHCQLFSAERDDTPASEPSEATSTWTLEREGAAPLEIVSMPGVFNHGGLDEGTAMLLDTLKGVAFRRALDVGCGAGVVGAALLASGEGDVDLVDSSALAVHCAQRSLERNALDRGAVRASDVYSDAHGPYELIVSNPPFHQGLDTDYDVAHRLVAEASTHLRRRGRLQIVGNRFVPYARWLETCFGGFDVLADDGRYRVYRAVRAA